jgi:hypothetical protein
MVSSSGERNGLKISWIRHVHYGISDQPLSEDEWAAKHVTEHQPTCGIGKSKLLSATRTF